MEKIGIVVKLALALLTLGLVITNAGAIEYHGIEFPAGASSFADEIVSSDLRGGAAGGDPENALSLPDRNSVSLGAKGSIILKFTDNSLATSGNSDSDLCVFEYGTSSTEIAEVFISTDMENWIKVGEANRKTLIDIDSTPGVIPGTRYCYVKLVDLNGKISNKNYEGADIDAVGAISSASPVEGRLEEGQEDERNEKAESIPEFPGIAIPMLAIVGMAFVFRKKR
ncbi:MAG: PEF-CTERM sorting domain-containing protein [Methanolobus sp.]|nr:PEF-CTERM sorting domain-containing protein [Methanolobus sp.]